MTDATMSEMGSKKLRLVSTTIMKFVAEGQVH